MECCENGGPDAAGKTDAGGFDAPQALIIMKHVWLYSGWLDSADCEKEADCLCGLMTPWWPPHYPSETPPAAEAI